MRPFIAAPRLRWAYLTDVRTEQDRRVAPLRNLSSFVPEADRARLDVLESVVLEKVELDAHASLQRWLRSWLLLHVPPAIVLMGLLVVHIVAVLLF